MFFGPTVIHTNLLNVTALRVELPIVLPAYRAQDFPLLWQVPMAGTSWKESHPSFSCSVAADVTLMMYYAVP